MRDFMLRFRFNAFPLFCSCVTLLVSPCTGQVSTSTGKSDAANDASEKQFQAHALHEAKKYELRKGSTSGEKLKLWPEPISRWTNPVPEKQMRGEVFLWTDDDRPAAVLCLFEMTDGNIAREYHEFTSLATGGLTTTGDSPQKWSPGIGQIKMAAVPDAPSPAVTPRLRLTQMRELARQFECEKTTRTGDLRTLRLQSQPLTRYQSESNGVIDGALFAFVEATDPEVFLLIEMRDDKTASQWRYGFVRMASVGIRASRANQTAWEAEPLPYDGYRNRPDLPYTLLFSR
jgi:hypothetical protein